MSTFEEALHQLNAQITKNYQPNLILLGIRSRGDLIAQRIQAQLASQGMEVLTGALDISLYRDDLHFQKVLPKLQSTIIPPTIDDSHVIIIDDVIQTGRTIRAALDAISDFGRPKTIKMGALVDLGGRELPISCDYAGTTLELPTSQKIKIQLSEVDSQDAILTLEKEADA